MKKANPPPGDGPELFRAASLAEEIASLDGQMAMLALHEDRTPSAARFRNFHKLRTAARHCPSAAYNLAMFLDETAGPRRGLFFCFDMQFRGGVSSMVLATVDDPRYGCYIPAMYVGGSQQPDA